MKRSAVQSCMAVVIALSLHSHATAVTAQIAADLFGGRPFLWVEGESASTISGSPGATWKIVTKGGPDMSTVTAGTPRPVLPNTSNASGAAIWAPSNDFSSHVPTAQYQLKFITPGTYQFFLRQSMYDSNNNGTLANEDSIFLPPAFNKNSGSDWVNAAGLDWDENDSSFDLPSPGYALDPDGYIPSVGNHNRDGWLELQNWGIKSEGVVTFATPAGGVSANGNFAWYNRPTTQGINVAGNFESNFGFKTEYTVTPNMVGQTLTFEIGMREVNVVIDGFLLIQTSNIYPNMDLLDIYSQAEVDAAILPQPVLGDYNGNGSVDAADYVLWRNGGPLLNQVHNPGTVSAEDYTEWRSRFGNLGSGSGMGSSGAVPEPSALALATVGAITVLLSRRNSVLPHNRG